MTPRASAPTPDTTGTTGTTDAPERSASGSSTARLHSSGRVDRLTFGVAIANLVAQIAIIVTGGAVRLTGSGLGCSTWPMCEPGQFAPVLHEEMSFHPIIEFGNRTLTGVLAVIAVALILAVYRREPTRHRPAALKRLTLVPLAGILVQAVIGGISVRVNLHPLLVGVHMWLSLALVAFSTYLVLRLISPDLRSRPLLAGSWRWAPAALGVLAAVLSLLGTFVTGTGPLSGDASEITRLGFDHEAISRAHALTVWIFLLVAAVTWVRVTRDPRAARAGELAPARRALTWLLGVCVINGVIGYTQYATGLPALMVGFHMVGAALFVAATAWACTRLYRRDVPAPLAP